MADLSKLNLDGTSRDIKDAKAFRTDDTVETAIADADTFPFYDASASGKRKSTYSNLFDKLRTSLGSMTAAQLKAGTDTTIKGMRADYAREGVRKIIGEAAGNDTIETLGGKASKSYKINEYFYANDGYYYVVTSAMTAGSTTITAGTNCSKTSVSGALENLRSECVPDFLMFSSSNSTITTTTGTIYTNWDVRLVILKDVRQPLGYEHRTICSFTPFLDVRLSGVSSKPTITIKNDELKKYGTIYNIISCYRFSGSTQYPCDYARMLHIDGENKLTLTPANFYSTAPSGYFIFTN